MTLSEQARQSQAQGGIFSKNQAVEFRQTRLYKGLYGGHKNDTALMRSADCTSIESSRVEISR